MLAVPTPQQPSLSAPELVPPNTEHQHHSIFPLRTHFHQLLPRHVTFHVRLQIHLLDSVPLVSGQFATKWKIKGGTTNGTATPNNKSGILHKVRRTSRRPSRPPSRQSTAGNEHEDDESSPESSSATEHSSNRRQNSYGPLGVSRTTTMDSKSSSKSILLNGTTTPDLLSDDYPTPSLTSASTSDSLPSSLPTSLTSSSTPTEYISRPRGITPFRPLRDHSVTWEHTLDSIVKMDVDRDSKDLLSSYLKLSVMQEVIPGDLDAPQNPKLGELHLNLAEYAGAGPNGDGKNGGATSVNRVTRRYLLEQSKTNATLKLTLEMERISGEMDFIPPPLPKDQIFAGVGALLENEVYQERPEALDYFVPANSRPPAMGSRTVSKSSTKSSSSRSSEQPTPTFDIEKLSFATGPQTTESLIDALFNPTRVTDQRKANPLTYFEPSSSKYRQANATFLPASLVKELSDSPPIDHDKTIGRRKTTDVGSIGSSSTSVYSFTTDSESAGTSESRSSASHSLVQTSPPVGRSQTDPQASPPSHHSGGGLKGFWRRRRPTTPVHTN